MHESKVFWLIIDHVISKMLMSKNEISKPASGAVFKN